MFNDELLKNACNQLDNACAKSRRDLRKAYKAIIADSKLSDDDKHFLFVVYDNLYRNFDSYKKWINGGV